MLSPDHNALRALETPALMLDHAALERNIAAMAARGAAGRCRVRRDLIALRATSTPLSRCRRMSRRRSWAVAS